MGDSYLFECAGIGCLAIVISATGSGAGADFAGARSSPQEPTFLATTMFVQVPVVVTDRQGRMVDGLDKDSFELRDNGNPVEITAFTHVRVRIPGHGLALGPLSGSTESSAAATDRNRVLWIVLDDLHMSTVRVTVAQDIARRLIQRWLGPGDLIGVRQVGSDSNETVLNDDVPAALSAIAAFHVRPKTPLHEQEEIQRARQLTSTLRGIGRAMSTRSNRRVSIVLLSEGIDYDVFNVQAPGSSDITESLQSALAAMREANVVLYAIDPRGLTSTEGTAVETGAPEGSVEAALAGAANRLRVGQISLRQLAEETGGFASLNDNSFDAAIDRIGEEMSNYYLLGFLPPDTRCEGGLRHLKVKVRVSGTRIRARSSYGCDQSRHDGR
jgi:VWFA-related protein